MNDCAQSKLPLLFERILNQIEERVNKTDNKQSYYLLSEIF